MHKCSLLYLQVSAWGGYVFIINLIPLHVFVLLLMGRYSARVYTAYTTFFILGLLLSMQVPFVGFQPIRTSEHMASAGTLLVWTKVALFWIFLSLMVLKARSIPLMILVPPPAWSPLMWFEKATMFSWVTAFKGQILRPLLSKVMIESLSEGVRV